MQSVSVRLVYLWVLRFWLYAFDRISMCKVGRPSWMSSVLHMHTVLYIRLQHIPCCQPFSGDLSLIKNLQILVRWWGVSDKCNDVANLTHTQTIWITCMLCSSNTHAFYGRVCAETYSQPFLLHMRLCAAESTHFLYWFMWVWSEG